MANRQRRPDHLKRNYGWDRARIDGTEGAATGHGVLAHNLVKISALAA
jgi:IS5 family transposase